MCLVNFGMGGGVNYNDKIISIFVPAKMSPDTASEG